MGWWILVNFIPRLWLEIKNMCWRILVFYPEQTSDLWIGYNHVTDFPIVNVHVDE
jgi:chromosome condensin MukBEF complex kleisin-like MukF subunit